MIKPCVTILSIACLATLTQCDTREKALLQSKVDSLRSELETSQEMAKTLAEVGSLMDSIDANRQVLRMNMMEGTSYDDYSARMQDLNKYVKDTQKRIADLEKSLKKSKSAANTYSASVTKLKADLESKNKEIVELQQRVEALSNENKNLIDLTELQDAEIKDKQDQLDTKQQELALIEARIQELMIQAKVSDADQFYARGQAVEEAANRTKLAPRKKKETLKEALELYKKSLSLGKQDAQAKISELEKKLK